MINPRSVTLVMTLIATALLFQLLGLKQIAEAQTASINSPGLPDNISYQPSSGTLFGPTCCISTDSITQGAIGDCYLMSSFAAIAMISPGSIQQAIHQNSDGTYSVRFYKPQPGGDPQAPTLAPVVYRINGDVPAIQPVYVANNVLAKLLTSSFPFVHPVDAYNEYQQDHPIYARKTNDTLWPLLMEKAYAAMIPGGYNSLGEGGGGYDAMQAITGTGGGEWTLTNKPAVNLLRGVTVTDVPAVADASGHCIICGFFNGKGATAVEPNIQVCVSQITTTPPVARKCTPICKPGHSCTERFGQSGFDMGTNPVPVMVEVLDIDKPGHENQIALFEEKDPTKCTTQSPCQEQPDDSSGTAPDESAAPLKISFEISKEAVQNNTVATLQDLDALLTKLRGRPVLAGTIAVCPSTFRCVAQNDHRVFAEGGICATGQPCLATDHEYYLKQYSRGTGTLQQALVTLGNPWGAAISGGEDVTLSLPMFQYAFEAISANYVTPVHATNCPCSK